VIAMFLQDLRVSPPFVVASGKDTTRAVKVNCSLFSERQYVFVMKIRCTRQTCSGICLARAVLGFSQMYQVTLDVLPTCITRPPLRPVIRLIKN
jgi:hypothetical protein